MVNNGKESIQGEGSIKKKIFRLDQLVNNYGMDNSNVENINLG